jgi:hypothetical protein
MAGLFGTDQPTYVGQPSPSKSSGGLFGMFPSTPDYVTSPSAPALPSSPSTKPSDGTASTSTNVPVVELAVKIANVLDVHGALALPPWLLDRAPALLPALLPLVRQWLADGFCRFIWPDGQVPPPVDPYDPQCGPPPAPPSYARPDVEQRVWDRE